mmetsp:Transcript_139900/g.363649  ORF Transcript_139900/g.363649 Transcript_139900/m.363649 type:complete len:347 (-) Transcript_139900:1137-2177(-)
MLHEARIFTFSLKQLRVGSLLDHATFVEHQDLSGVFHCGKPMRDDEGCGLVRAHQLIQRLLHVVLVLRVQSTCGLVQEQHLRFPDDCSSNCNSLLLPSRDASRLLAWVRVVFTLQPTDKLVCFGQLGSPFDVALILVAGGTVSNVILNRPVEENRLLLHDTNLRAQPPETELFEVCVIQENHATCGVVKPQQQPADRALASTAFANKGDDVAGICMKVQLSQNWLIQPLLVGEANLLKLDLTITRSWPLAALIRRDLLWPTLQQLHKFARGSNRLLEVYPDVGQVLKTILEQNDVLRKGSIPANRQTSIDDLVHSNGQHRDVSGLRQAELSKPQHCFQVDCALDDP